MHSRRVRSAAEWPRRRFLDDASHQLRTPLAALKTQVDFSVGQPSESDKRELLRDIGQTTEQTIRLVNQLIARAVETHASDVHLEPFPDRLRVRYRYDGVLHEVEPPPPRLQGAIISRVMSLMRKRTLCISSKALCIGALELKGLPAIICTSCLSGVGGKSRRRIAVRSLLAW